MAALALALAGLLVHQAPAALADFQLHAHRGAPLEMGEPVAPENSLEASYRVAERYRPHYVELDVKLTSDRVPVNLHDATLDRTTNCSGRVVDRTIEEVRRCRLDQLGTGDTMRPIARPTERVPTLEEMLDFSLLTNTRLNIEIKNLITEADFEPNPPSFVDPIIDAVHRRGMLDRDHVLIQTFWPADLDRARQRIQQLVPDAERRPPLHLLTLSPLNEGAVAFSALAGYDGLGPQWPPLTGGAYFALAEASGLPAVPWTINDAAGMRSALEQGAAGLITDDMALANEVTGRPGPRLRLRMAAPKRQRHARGVGANVACAGRGDCLVAARARLRLQPRGARARTVNLGRSRLEVPQGTRRRAEIRISQRVRRAIGRTLHRRGRVVARIDARAVDAYRTLEDRARVTTAIRR